MVQMVKKLPAMWETFRSLGWKDPLEKGLATHSSILAWKTPWTVEPGKLQSVGSQRVRHDWAVNTHTHTHTRVQHSYVRLLTKGVCGVKLLATQKPVNRPGWWKRKFALFQMLATGEGEGGRHLSKGQLPNLDRQGVNVFTDRVVGWGGGYTQKQHSHPQQSSSNWSSVAWPASSLLF